MTISAEDAEIKAKKIYDLSTDLGVQMGIINDMAKLNWGIIRSNQDAYETIMIEGENVFRALRTIAMALDRAVIVKCQKE